ncbi:hypothetical protein OFB58_27305, partial [Escherichia coli]|nr:hypothetical protein [Escherichia coli]
MARPFLRQFKAIQRLLLLLFARFSDYCLLRNALLSEHIDFHFLLGSLFVLTLSIQISQYAIGSLRTGA